MDFYKIAIEIFGDALEKKRFYFHTSVGLCKSKPNAY